MSRFSPAAVAAVSPAPRSAKRPTLFLAALTGVVVVVGVVGQRAIQQAAKHRLENAARAAREEDARKAWDTVATMVQKDRATLYGLANRPAGSPSSVPSPFGRSPVTRQTVVTRNLPALQAFRSAFALPYRAAPYDASGSTSGTHAQLNYQPLACLLLLDGDEKSDRNDVLGASEAYLDLIQMGQTLPRGGALSALLSGYSYQRMGQTALWKIVGKMDGATARHADRRLEALNAACEESASYALTLEEEKKRGEAALHDLYHDPKKLQQAQQYAALMSAFQARMQARGGGPYPIFLNPGASPSPSPPPNVWNRTAQEWEKWKTLRQFDLQMDASLAQARQPYQVWQQNAALASGASGGRFGQAQGMVSFSPFYTSYGSPGMVAYAQTEWTAQQTENRLLLVALAVRAFREDHAGRDPAALSDLVPTYLSRIPDDPYSFPVAPLCWKPAAGNGNGILYSVGPDGKDDGGAPVQGFIRQAGMGRMFTRYASFGHPVGKGDLVAGKNGP